MSIPACLVRPTPLPCLNRSTFDRLENLRIYLYWFWNHLFAQAYRSKISVTSIHWQEPVLFLSFVWGLSLLQALRIKPVELALTRGKRGNRQADGCGQGSHRKSLTGIRENGESGRDFLWKSWDFIPISRYIADLHHNHPTMAPPFGSRHLRHGLPFSATQRSNWRYD